MAENHCRVLLVEDSDSDADRIRLMLNRATTRQFTVTRTVRLAEALAKLQSDTEFPDVVLLDLSLPDSTGLETLTILRRNGARTVPIVVLTGLDDSDTSLRAVKEGAQDWLVKDNVDLTLLERTLHYAIDRHQMQLQLRRSEAKFRQLAENINEVFWIYDVDSTRLTYISPAYERIWGRAIETLLEDPDHWPPAVHADDREMVNALLADAVAGKPFEVQYRIQQPTDTVRWIQDRGVPVSNAAGQVYRIVGIAEDITERKDLERNIAELTSSEQRRIGQELHDSLGQQLTGVGLFAASLHHNLETAAPTEAATASELVDNIRIAQSQLGKLVKGLMPVEVDARGLMSALSQLAMTTERLCNVVCKFVCDQPVAVENNTTATHLFHIAQESVNNAVRHGQSQHIHVSLAGGNETVTVQIQDDGVGIGSDVDSDSMGLRIMQHRAGLIGGKLDVRNAAEGGTVVTCTISQDKDHENAKS